MYGLTIINIYTDIGTGQVNESLEFHRICEKLAETTRNCGLSAANINTF